MPTEDTGAAPERVDAGMLVLRRLRATDAGEIAAAVSASMEHLRPWMPWATAEAADPRTQRVRVAEADEMWAAGTDYIYSVFAAEESVLVGAIGLHRRGGDGGNGRGIRSRRAVGADRLVCGRPAPPNRRSLDNEGQYEGHRPGHVVEVGRGRHHRLADLRRTAPLCRFA